MTKTTCPLTRKQFADSAKPITVSVAGQSIVLDPKQFSTGSFGFGNSSKVIILIGGEPVKCQASFNLTVVGSKEAEDE